MTTKLEFQSIEAVECDALVTIGFEEQKGGPLAGETGELYESKEFSGKPLEFALLHRPQGLKAKRLLLVGGGKPDKFNLAVLRKAVGAAVRHLKSKSVRDIALLLDGEMATPEHVAAAIEGAILGDFEPDAL